VGSATDIPVDVRIVAATNENLEKAIEQGRFRQDLYHRINEFTLEVPPLRNRLDDLEEFVTFFVEQSNEELGKEIKGVSPKAIEVMRQMRWNGNIRELRNVIRRCVLFAEGETIEAEDLPVFPDFIEKTTTSNDDFALRPGNEREQIEAALAKARGNKTVAARLLQIDRKTLYNKMHQLGLDL
jgi:two-component system response regulator HydG